MDEEGAYFQERELLLSETKLLDCEFRKTHCLKCTQKDKDRRRCYANERGVTFCDLLVKSRNRDQELNQKWGEHILSAPWIQDLPSLKRAVEMLVKGDEKRGD